MGRRQSMAATAVSVCLAAAAALAQSPQFAEDCRAFAAFPSRATGTDGSARAAEHFGRRLAALKPDLVLTQTFATVRERSLRCELRLEGSGGTTGRVQRLYPLRSNSAILPVTPPEGLRGPLLDLRDGARGEYQERSVRGAIVLLDFNCGDSWLRAFRLGAAAVIFARGAPMAAWQPHFVEANVNLPRFFYDGPAADLPDGAQATVFSEGVWEPATGRNVLALFKGSAPVFDQEREEAVVLAAPLDSYGEVPELSPGARGAANLAGLLSLAEAFSRHRARRHVVIAAFDAEAMCHLGSSRFYAALETAKAEATAASRRRFVDNEQAFLAGLRALLDESRPLEAQSPAHRQLLNRLVTRSAERAHDVAARLYELRSAPSAENEPLRRQLAQEEQQWNDLRRALGKDRAAGLASDVAARLEVATDDVRAAVDARLRELEAERAEVESAQRLHAALGETWIALHASLMLGDSADRWGLAIGGDSSMHSADDNPGLYGKVQAVFLRADRELESLRRGPTGFERATADQTLAATRVIWGGRSLVHSGEAAGLFGIYNLALATRQEAAAREGTPDDTLAALDLAPIEKQVRGVALLLTAVADMEVPAPAPQETGVADQTALSLRRGVVANKEYLFPRFEGETSAGATVAERRPGSSIATPVTGAVVHVRFREPPLLTFNARKDGAFRDFLITRTDGNGAYAIGPMPSYIIWWWMRGTAFAFDAGGRVQAASDQESYGGVRQRLNLFACRPGWVVLPPGWSAARQAVLPTRLLSARDNGDLDARKSYRELWDGVLTWYADARETSVKISGLPVLMELNTGAETHARTHPAASAAGVGMAMSPAWEPAPAGRRSGIDLWRLNDSRLRVLQGKNIIDSSLAELHGRAEDLLLQSAAGPVTLRTEALDTSAFLASQPVYARTRAMIDDLVFAVLILLGLAVPFAFAMERVVVGATTVYRQIAWFAAFFSGTFLVLFFSHPAFAIANTPIIIFLGFTILVLAGLVITILMRRFESELKAIQGMPATIHSDDVSRVGTLMAAVQMGISTMRRRPMRTALTAITIILLTFTILSFASFGTQTGIVRLMVGPLPEYRGVFVRHVNWKPLSNTVLDLLEGRWGAQAKVFARRWVSPRQADTAGLFLSREDAAGGVTLRGALGIDPGEIERRPDLARVLGADLEGKVLLTAPVARVLGVAPGDAVRLAGQRLVVGRLVEGPRLAAAADLDNSSILPANFTEAYSARPTTQDELGGEREMPVNWTSLPVDEVAIVSESTARRLGAELEAVSLYPAGPDAAGEMAADIARMLPLPVTGTLENGVYRHIIGAVVAASGVGDLLFPILLGGLVVFGTMLGSVADREREIYTFSALGLAPRHVATLFLAESVVYSVIGGMGGYLLANAVLRALYFAAAHGWASVPEMNMSSTNTIVTILIVMGTVLASAVYPALRASRSANPGLMRTWRPPEPRDDALDMVFPFTVSAYDITGVVSFLREHFNSHSDTGLGRFMARGTALRPEPGDMLSLHSEIALAPFDLGVSQGFRLSSAPSPIPGINQVRIQLERRSGQPKDWVRLNRVFLDDLRQQFLIWRALPEETMDKYRSQTLATIGSTAHGQTGS